MVRRYLRCITDSFLIPLNRPPICNLIAIYDCLSFVPTLLRSNLRVLKKYGDILPRPDKAPSRRSGADTVNRWKNNDVQVNYIRQVTVKGPLGI